MTPECWIEPLAGEEDLQGVMEVDRESFGEPWTREMYDAELANVGVSNLIVLRTAEWRVAGYCSFWFVVDETHINNVAVRRSLRGQGLGRLLVSTVIRKALEQGSRRMLLEVRSTNIPARKLYESLGFQRIGLRAGYYAEPPDDALVLALELQKLG